MAQNTQNTNENKMGVMPVGRLLLTMSAPMVASMLFQALYNIVDSVFVARLGQDALNAVSLAFPVQMLMIAFAGGTGVGMSALLSMSLGAGNRKRADQTANTGIYLFLCTVVVFMLFGFAARFYYTVQTSNEEIIRYGASYVRICLFCSLALFSQMCGERLLQSTGRTDLAMIPQLVGAVLNMVLDPIMIFGLLGFPRLEVAGAAVATVCGQVVAACIGIFLNLRKNTEIRFDVHLIRFDASIAREIYRVGVPSIVMQSIGSVMNFSLNHILIGFTEAATAVFGAYYKIQSFVFMPVFGMNNAVVPILSYNIGADKMDRVKKAVKRSMLAAVGIMTVGCILFETIPGVLLGIFSPTEEMIAVGVKAFRIIGIHYPIAGFCIVAGSVCQALRKPLYSMIVSICRQLVVLLPVAYLLSLSGNLDLVWFAFPIAESISLVMNIFFLRSAFRSANAARGQLKAE